MTMTRRKQPHADSYLSLFSGAGGLDLGFERAGFHPMGSVEIDSHCVRTLRHNCPTWPVLEADVREYEPSADTRPEVLLAGFPCQGFSLGGNRRPDDERNDLFREVVRVTKAVSPTAVVVENVLNLRTMKHPITGRPFVEEIAHAFVDLGYDVHHGIFRVCDYGVPQTRRRFLFIAFRDGAPAGYSLPQPTGLATIRDALFDLANGPAVDLPNHDPQWGFKSAVHVETGAAFAKEEMVVPVRFSRTASDGNPIRSFVEPFPAIDTATVWGWAQGRVRAERVHKDRRTEKFIRNPNANVTLWRIEASRLRTFTHREYARLQTFPDTWQFLGNNKRDIHKQIGNAVPVEFATVVARNVREAIEAKRTNKRFRSQAAQLQLMMS
jgi:DNA (cytosine-5)-methyltransferase 1